MVQAVTTQSLRLFLIQLLLIKKNPKCKQFFVHLYYGCVQNIPTTIQNLWKISSLINFEDISKIHNKLGKNETWCGDYLDHFKRNFVVIATCLEEFRYFGPYFVTCLLILYVKFLHFSCGVSQGSTLTGILMPWLIDLLAITFISHSHHMNYASFIFMSLQRVYWTGQ